MLCKERIRIIDNGIRLVNDTANQITLRNIGTLNRVSWYLVLVIYNYRTVCTHCALYLSGLFSSHGFPSLSRNNLSVSREGERLTDDIPSNDLTMLTAAVLEL